MISEREKEFLTYEVRRGVGGNRLFEAAVTNGVESEGLYLSLVVRVRGFFFKFITNPELRFIKRSSVYV